MLSEKLTLGFFGVEVREHFDDSMLIVTKKPTRTGTFYYLKTPKFKVVDEKDWNYNNEVYGIYEDERGYVWTENRLGGRRLYLKEKLKVV